MTKSSPVTGYLLLLVKSVGLVLDKVSIRFEEHASAFCSWSAFVWRGLHTGTYSQLCALVFQTEGGCVLLQTFPHLPIIFCEECSIKGTCVSAHTSFKKWTICKEMCIIHQNSRTVPLPHSVWAYTKLWHGFWSFGKLHGGIRLVSLAVDRNQPISTAQKGVHVGSCAAVVKP